jgi:TetR/AcrR family transcriptional regulator
MAEKQTAKRNRREEILQSLALMLESSDGSQRITTAKLAASVGVSRRRCTVIFRAKPGCSTA